MFLPLLTILLLPGVAYALTHQFVFNLTDEYCAKDGVYKSMKMINRQSPGPPIEVDEDDWVHVIVNNYLQVSAAFHFHGILQLGTPWADGVPGITQYPIPSGGTYNYTFQAKNQSGALWYHSHFRGYLSDGLYGAIYIRPKKERQRPYSLITSDEALLATLMELERRPSYLIADDIFPTSMDDVVARMFHFGVDPVCIQSILVNGKGRVRCHSHEKFYRLASKNKFLPRIPYFDSMGCLRDESFLTFKDVALDHFALEIPGYSAECKPTLSDNYVHFTNGSRWQYINVINAGGQYTKAFSIDDHKLYVVAVDGLFVQPKSATNLVLPVGSRFTVCFETEPSQHDSVKKPFAIRFAAVHTPQFIDAVALLVYGKPEEYLESDLRLFQDTSEHSNGVRYQDLDGYPLSKNTSLLWPHDTRPFEASSSLTETGPANLTFGFYLNRFEMVHFSMFEDRTLLPYNFEASKPLLQRWYCNDTDGMWQSKTSLQPVLQKGQVVDLIINNYKHINHPIHLHGHHVHLISFSEQENFPYRTVEEAVENNYGNLNLANPPYSDVVIVAVGGHVVLRFTANNPGIWLLHCHNIGHLLGGMGAVLFEQLEEIPRP